MVDARNTPFWNVPWVWDEVRTVRKCSDASIKVSDMTSSLEFSFVQGASEKAFITHCWNYFMKHQQHQGYVEWLSPGVKHRVGVHGRGAERWLSWTVRGHSEAPLLAPSWGTICGNRLIYETLFIALLIYTSSPLNGWVSRTTHNFLNEGY